MLGSTNKDYTKNNRTVNKEWITHDNIISLFTKYNVPKSYDFLSIDTDFKDYWILQSILEGGYRPRVICAEINKNCYPFDTLTVPKNIKQKEWLDDNDYFGATPQSFTNLVKKYGYDLVYCEKNAINCFFVLNAPNTMKTKLNDVFTCKNLHNDAGTQKWYNTQTGKLVNVKRIDTK